MINDSFAELVMKIIVLGSTAAEEGATPADVIIVIDGAEGVHVLDSSAWVRRAQLNRKRQHRPKERREREAEDEEKDYWMYRDSTEAGSEGASSDQEKSQEKGTEIEERKQEKTDGYHIPRSHLHPTSSSPLTLSSLFSRSPSDSIKLGRVGLRAVTDTSTKKRKVSEHWSKVDLTEDTPELVTSSSRVAMSVFKTRDDKAQATAPNWIQALRTKRKTTVPQKP
ncbi:uncharacterized protein KIAA1671 homolog [Amia ocellicauda]|uniref:uncharacterized protein KIAA1671 homolog n=1 Tax=Amia ocellicauda TaxID=2972642 RepID=UPI0034640A3D